MRSADLLKPLHRLASRAFPPSDRRFPSERGATGELSRLNVRAMAVWIVRDGAPQKTSPIDGASLRHLRGDCPWLCESPLSARVNAENTEDIRLATVRCEHPRCWAAYRAKEGDSPFGCVDCGTEDFHQGIHRDREGRYRLCASCYAARAEALAGSRESVRDRVFEPIVARWEVARKNAKAFRRGNPGRCEHCGGTFPPSEIHAHHRDGDRRNNRLSNREWLCAECHRKVPHDRRSYADRNRAAAC